MRHYVRWHRNPGYPAALRNAPIILPAVSGFLAPLVLLTALPVIQPYVNIGLPDRVVGFLWIGGFGYTFLGFGVLAVLSIWPPRRWTPPWLVEEDSRLGWHPLPPDRFDKATAIVLGPPFIVAGSALLVVAIVALFVGR